MKRNRRKVYLETSVLIRVVDPTAGGHGDAFIFIDRLKRRRYELLTSTVTWSEKLKPITRNRLRVFTRAYGIKTVHLPFKLKYLRSKAENYVREVGASRKKVYNTMHLMAASYIGAEYIAAVDKFIRRHSRYFRLKYINPFNIDEMLK